MAGRRARTGRGWDAAPPRARSSAAHERAAEADGASGQRASGHSGVSAPAPDERGYGGRRRRFAAGSAGGSQTRASDGGSPGSERDQATRAREICLRLLAVRPRTRQELATALHQRGIPDEVAGEILQRYGEVGMVDDRAFARAWVTSRHHGKGLAGRALAGELRRKGVEAEAIGEALDELSDGVEARTARDLVDRKLRHDRGGAPGATLRRLVGLLARKGYAPGLAFRVVKEAVAAAAVDEADGAETADRIAAEELEAALEAAVLDADAAESEAEI